MNKQQSKNISYELVLCLSVYYRLNALLLRNRLHQFVVSYSFLCRWKMWHA